MHIVIKYALVFPNITFKVYSNPILHLEILKQDEAENVLQILEIQDDTEISFIHFTINSFQDITIEFYISNFTARFRHPIRGIYLNKRLISCPPMKEAIDNVYKQFRLEYNVPNDLQPTYFIMITIPKDKIDIRRHYSTKRVVFKDQDQFVSVVATIVRDQFLKFLQNKSNENVQQNPINTSSPNFVKLPTPTQTRSSSNQMKA